MANYNASVNLLIGGTSNLDKLVTRITQLEGLIERINATPIDLSKTAGRGTAADRLGVAQRRVQQLRDDYLELGEAQKRWQNGSRTGNAVGGNATTNQLRAQSDLLQSIANNSKLASVQFKEMTIAAALANAKANEAGRQRLSVLAEAFSGQGSRSQMGNVRGNASLQLVDRLVASYPTITKSEAALNAYKQELGDIQQLVPMISNEYKVLENRIAEVNRELASSGLRGQVSAVSPQMGPATSLSSVAASEKRLKYQEKINDQLAKMAAIETRIEQAALSGTQKQKLRNTLDQAAEALGQHRLQDAVRITSEIDRQRMSLERLNRASQGKTITSPVDQEVANRKRLNHLINSSQLLEQGLLTAKAKGLDVTEATQRVQQLINNLNRSDLTIDKQQLDLIDEILNGLRSELQLKKAIANTSIAEAKAAQSGAMLGPGSPTGELGFLQARKKQTAEQKAARAQKMESVALGVGFPLMFGAGPGSIAGSLAGSFVGSGFGGQILGGAFGQVLDDAAKSAADFARSMREGGDAAGYLTEKLGYLNPETKALIQNAQQSGQTAVAAALAQKELANVIGGQAASDLKNYGELWDFTGRQFQKFTLLLQAGLPQIIAQTLAAATGLTGLYAIVSKLPLVAGLAGMVAPKEKPQTVEAQTRSKELQEQLKLARANYQVTLQNNTANSQGYLISKAQTIQIEKQNKYEEIMRDLKAKKFSNQDKILKVLALEVSTQEKLRNLEIERVQLIQQRNQAALAQAQAVMEVGIIQQQVQLAQEQNTASEVRRASLQGQIGIQQALNRLESINLQIAQERANTQRDINNNKIKELEAQRSIATAQVDLAQAQAAQQQQQATRTAQADLLNTEKTRKTLILEFINLAYKEAELSKGELYTLKQRYDAIDKEAALRKYILNTERQLEILQRPDLELEINTIYGLRFAVLEKTLNIQKQITQNELKQVAAQQQMAQYRIKREAETSIQGTQRQITKAEIGIQSFGMGEGQKAAIELENEQQQRRLDLLQAYTDKTKELRASIASSTGDTLRIKQLELDTEKQTYATRSEMLVQLEQLEKKQLVLNEITRTYGPIIQGVGDAVGSALTKGIQGLVEGTTTAQQVFADFLKSIGDILMQEGAKIIATYTAIAIARQLAGLFGGGGGGGNGGGAQGFQMPEIAPGVGSLGPQRMFAFADGGNPPVGRPSLVGEQGPELFVPRTSGTIVPAGPTAGIREAMANGNGQSNASPVLNMSFQTSTINGVEYVSRDQLEAAMMETRRQASRDGAKRGMTMTLDRLQQSPSTRSRVGLG